MEQTKKIVKPQFSSGELDSMDNLVKYFLEPKFETFIYTLSKFLDLKLTPTRRDLASNIVNLFRNLKGGKGTIEDEERLKRCNMDEDFKAFIRSYQSTDIEMEKSSVYFQNIFRNICQIGAPRIGGFLDEAMSTGDVLVDRDLKSFVELIKFVETKMYPAGCRPNLWAEELERIRRDDSITAEDANALARLVDATGARAPVMWIEPFLLTMNMRLPQMPPPAVLRERKVQTDAPRPIAALAW